MRGVGRVREPDAARRTVGSADPTYGLRPRYPYRARRRPNLRGFTLIELVIVVATVAILAAIAIPRMAGTLARRRIEFAAGRVVSDLRLAQRQARLSSASRTVQFDVASNSYRLLGVPSLNGPSGEYTVRLTDTPYEVSVVSASFGGDARLIFDGYGVPDSGGSVVLGSGGNQATISVDPASGTATVQYTWIAIQS